MHVAKPECKKIGTDGCPKIVMKQSEHASFWLTGILYLLWFYSVIFSVIIVMVECTGIYSYNSQKFSISKEFTYWCVDIGYTIVWRTGTCTRDNFSSDYKL